jgi:inner membrane protein
LQRDTTNTTNTTRRTRRTRHDERDEHDTTNTGGGAHRMASIGHAIVGAVCAEVEARYGQTSRGGGGRAASWPRIGLFAALGLLPDVDVLGLALGVPYGAPFGHRGASHALLAAVPLALAATALLRVCFAPPARAHVTFLCALVAIGSHGPLDAMTTGGHGVALLYPWSLERYFLPWRPIPVAPIGVNIVSGRGLRVLAVESILFLPVLAWWAWFRFRSVHRS